MAQPTSSRNRSTRRSTRPVTRGSNPQRSNRQAASTAQVTNSGGGTRGSARVTNGAQRANTGSARVTGGERAALPPGERGGALAVRQPPQRQLPGSNPNQRRLPGTAGGADTVRGSGVRTGRPGATRAALPATTSRPQPTASVVRQSTPSRAGNALRSVVGTRGRAIGAGTAIAGSMLSGDVKGAAITGGTYAAGRALQAIPNPTARVAGKALELAAPLVPSIANSLSSGSSKATPTSRRAGARTKADLIGGAPQRQVATRSSDKQGPPVPARLRNAPPAQQLPPQAAAPAQGSSRTTSRGTSTASSSSSPSSQPTRSRSATPPVDSRAGLKNQDPNFRGNLFEKTFGYKKGEAPDQLRNRSQDPPAPDAPSAAEQKVLDRLKILKDKEKQTKK